MHIKFRRRGITQKKAYRKIKSTYTFVFFLEYVVGTHSEFILGKKQTEIVLLRSQRPVQDATRYTRQQWMSLSTVIHGYFAKTFVKQNILLDCKKYFVTHHLSAEY
jgi:hypothetical protein